MMTPTIHLNGTSRDALVSAYLIAIHRIEGALSAMRDTVPNGRDYYPQGAGAIEMAIAEHLRRMKAIEAVRDELAQIAEAI